MFHKQSMGILLTARMYSIRTHRWRVCLVYDTINMGWYERWKFTGIVSIIMNQKYLFIIIMIVAFPGSCNLNIIQIVTRNITTHSCVFGRKINYMQF